MKNELLNFKEKFSLNTLKVFEGDNWIASVRPVQLTLGSLVISSSHGKKDFTSLAKEESAELVILIGKIDEIVKYDLGADKINVICLMMQDPIIHFHILPRYSKPCKFDGELWEDIDFPNPPIFRNSGINKPLNKSLVNFYSKAINKL